VLQSVAVWCSVLPCVAVCGSILECVAVRCSVLPCVAACCSMLQCVAVCCSVLPRNTCDPCLGLSHAKTCNILQTTNYRSLLQKSPIKETIFCKRVVLD